MSPLLKNFRGRIRTQKMKYSEEFKKAVVQKYLDRGNRKGIEIIESTGVSRSLMYQWRMQFANMEDMKKPTSPQKRSVSEKLKFIMEYNVLSLSERGEYLRKNGLHEEHLNEWIKQVEEALAPIKKNSRDRDELIAEQKKNKKLEKDLHRKEKALAEASALLILKKKADLIWGSEEEE